MNDKNKTNIITTCVFAILMGFIGYNLIFQQVSSYTTAEQAVVYYPEVRSGTQKNETNGSGLQQSSSTVQGDMKKTGYNIQSTPTKQGKDKSYQNTGSQGVKYSLEEKSMLNAGIHKDLVPIQIKIAKEYKIHPYYLGEVSLAENGRNPWAVGDNGCSYGAYQFNKCPGNRDEQIRFGKKFEECAKDYECSTRMVAEKIRSAYKCKVDDNGYIENFYECLPIHNGTNYKQRYVDKLVKANQILFTMGG